MHASTMARRENTVELNFIDTDFSSGDSNQMKSKHYKEENNNEVDELSKDFSEMGCIVDAVKRPNICVEDVYEESESENEVSEAYNEEDAYSDEFEEDKSEEEGKSEEGSIDSVKSIPKSMIDTSREPTARSSVKLTKSQSSMGSHKPPCSMSGRSTSFGSITSQKTRRINMSFTNERLREIERHNHILLSKILSARNVKKSSIPAPLQEQEVRRPVPSAAVCRKNQQKKIDHDNMILLKKIQRVKSSACSTRPRR